MCITTKYTLLRDGKKIAFVVDELDARLFAEALNMYELLRETYIFFLDCNLNSQLLLDITECLSRVVGVPAQNEKIDETGQG